MSEEEINRKLEFIIEQQAQFVADIHSLREAQAADSAFMRESYHTLTGAVTTIVNVVGQLAEAQQRTDAKLAELVEAQARTDARVAELTEALARTDERLAQTDERLNIFINVVEKYISRNGGNGPQESG
jgi:hypothetical protein